jgi:hypothetical protein
MVDSNLERAKFIAMELGSDRSRYAELKKIREIEINNARLFGSLEPNDMPDFNAWMQMLEDNDSSWWFGQKT